MVTRWTAQARGRSEALCSPSSLAASVRSRASASSPVAPALNTQALLAERPLLQNKLTRSDTLGRHKPTSMSCRNRRQRVGGNCQRDARTTRSSTGGAPLPAARMLAQLTQQSRTTTGAFAATFARAPTACDTRTSTRRGRRLAVSQFPFSDFRARAQATVNSRPWTAQAVSGFRKAALRFKVCCSCATPAALQHLAPWAAWSCHKHVRAFRRRGRRGLLEVPEAAGSRPRVSVKGRGNARRRRACQFEPWMQKPSLYMLQSCFHTASQRCRRRRAAARGVATLMSSLECLNGQSGS